LEKNRSKHAVLVVSVDQKVLDLLIQRGLELAAVVGEGDVTHGIRSRGPK
jgi:hypothetical protein